MTYIRGTAGRNEIAHQFLQRNDRELEMQRLEGADRGKSGRRKATADLWSLLGALVKAGAVDDQALPNEILAASRGFLSGEETKAD